MFLVEKLILKFSSLLILFFILTYSLIFTIGTDYAWYIQIIDYYIFHNEFYNQISNSYGGWGTIFIPIHAFFVKNLGTYYLNYWLFNLFSSLVGIYFLHKLLRLFNISRLSSQTSILLYIGFTFSTGFFAGTRPESIYVSSMIIELYFIFIFFRTNQYRFIYIATLISVLGALSHPNGIINFVILFFTLIRIMSSKTYKIFHIIINIFLMNIMFYFGITFHQTVKDLISSTIKIASDTGHSIPFYYEPIRYFSFLFTHSFIALIFILCFILTIITMIKNFSSMLKQNESFIILLSFIFVILYLTVIGAKWDYYLVLFFPFVILMIAQYLNTIDNKIIIYVYVFVSVILFSIIIENFKKNEIFLKAFHIPSERVSILEKVKQNIQNKTILTPIQTYPLFQNNCIIIPFEQMAFSPTQNNIDYVIMNILRDKKEYEDQFNVRFEYVRSFVYNGSQYNLFKVIK